MAEGKEEEGLVAQAKLNAAASSPDKFDNRAEKGAKAKVLSIANPMNTVSRATGGRKADVAAPLYFPGAKSTALRSHSGVKFVVYRVDSPEDVSDPITIIFKLDLSAKTLRVSNPAALSQKMSRKYYELKNMVREHRPPFRRGQLSLDPDRVLPAPVAAGYRPVGLPRQVRDQPG